MTGRLQVSAEENSAVTQQQPGQADSNRIIFLVVLDSRVWSTNQNATLKSMAACMLIPQVGGMPKL